MILLKCSCGQEVTAKDGSEGKVFACPVCGGTIVVRRENAIELATPATEIETRRASVQRVARGDGMPGVSIEVPADVARQMFQPAPVARQQPEPAPQMIYVQAPQQAPIHVSQHVVNNLGQQRGTSGLGVAALVLGILALLVCWIPFLGMLSIPVAVLGAMLGGLGFLISLAGGRSGVGMPFAGTLACILAIAVAFVSTGATVGVMGKAIDDAAKRNANQPASVPQTQTPDMRDFEASTTPDPVQAKSITPATPTTPKRADALNPVAGPPLVKVPTPVFPTISPQARLSAAVAAVGKRVQQEPGYLSLVRERDRLAAVLAQTRNTGTPQEKLDASAAWNKARLAVDKAWSDALDSDPDVLAARQAAAKK